MTQTEYGLRIAPRSIQEFLSFFPVTCGAVDKIINSLPKDQDGRVVMPSYIDIHNEKECILLHFVYSENGKVRIIKFNIAEQVIAPR